MPAVKRTELEVFSGGGKIAKNRAKQPGTLPFAFISTSLKTDPGAFRFCQIERIFAPRQFAAVSAYPPGAADND